MIRCSFTLGWSAARSLHWKMLMLGEVEVEFPSCLGVFLTRTLQSLNSDQNGWFKVCNTQTN
jgi:hypothetical protein